MGERLPVEVADDEAPPIQLGVGLVDGPGSQSPPQAADVDLRRWRSACVQHAQCWEVGGFLPSEAKSSGAFREPEGTDAAGERGAGEREEA